MFDWTKNEIITGVEGTIALIANAVIRVQHRKLSVGQDSAILKIMERLGESEDESRYHTIVDRYNKVKSSEDTNNIDFYVRSLSHYSRNFRIRILDNIVEVLMIENDITNMENEGLIYRIATGLGIFGWSIERSLPTAV